MHEAHGGPGTQRQPGEQPRPAHGAWAVPALLTEPQSRPRAAGRRLRQLRHRAQGHSATGKYSSSPDKLPTGCPSKRGSHPRGSRSTQAGRHGHSDTGHLAQETCRLMREVRSNGGEIRLLQKKNLLLSACNLWQPHFQQPFQTVISPYFNRCSVYETAKGFRTYE